MTEQMTYTKKDFANEQQVKWCPGCGDYAILSATQMAMAKIGVPPHKVAVVSGIGCSSRFPYYMGTYGLHSIHGRAPAFATGLKIQNPDLSVWVITGDGDGLSIGGNHFAHIIRRNLDINIILFNNEIYGLTKGQYSPTSKIGTTTGSTPYGSIDRPFSPAKFSMGAGATFYARTIDTDPKHMMEIMEAAHNHKGTSVVEVYQNCVIFNDKVHDLYTNRATRDDHSIRLEAGKPMIYGKDKNKAIYLDGLNLKVGTIGVDIELDRVLIHDPSNENLALMLTNLYPPDFPVPVGVLKSNEGNVIYEQQLHNQIDDVVTKKGKGEFTKLLRSGEIWDVK
jgi:2-oxoglutarate/2-oxoacid ferredoxin oxidoreductase subunit beta